MGIFDTLEKSKRVQGRAGELVELRGFIKKVMFSKPDFTAAVVETDDGEVSFRGNFTVRESDSVVIKGRWIEHPKFGLQVNASGFSFDQELSVSGLERHLAEHPDMRGVIGPARARKLVAALGLDFARVVVEEPQRVADAAGISLEKAELVRAAWLRTKDENVARVELYDYGLTPRQVANLEDKFKSVVTAAKFVRDDPYHLIHEVSGFGFKTVDAVALKSGRARTDPSRLRAGALHKIREQVERRGDCWLYRDDVVEQVTDELRPTGYASDRDLISRALDELVEAERLASFKVGERCAVADRRIYDQERHIAEALAERALLQNQNFSGIDDVLNDVDVLCPGLNEKQREAVIEAGMCNVLCITGGAGTGKTFTVASIVALYEEHRKIVVMVAPTGKAAKRLEQVVGRTATTIHRFLGMQGRAFEADADARGGVRLLDRQPDVVIVDEASMVDVPLMSALLAALDKKTALVLVGDHNQLPPIGPGCVLRDIVQRRPVHVAVLDEVVRQSGPLKTNAVAILAGEVSDSVEATEIEGKRVIPWAVMDEESEEYVAGYVCELYRSMLESDFGFDPLKDAQVLTPQHGTAIGTRRLNRLLQKIVQEKYYGVIVPDADDGDGEDDGEEAKAEILTGDRVIHTKNNYDLGVMNGAVGMVESIEGGKIYVRHEDGLFTYTPDIKNQIELAYALTIHKYQGSEIPCAVVVMHSAHKYMHNKNLFYTAVTRAKKTAIVVGDYQAMVYAARKEESERRKTLMSVVEMAEVA